VQENAITNAIRNMYLSQDSAGSRRHVQTAWRMFKQIWALMSEDIRLEGTKREADEIYPWQEKQEQTPDNGRDLARSHGLLIQEQRAKIGSSLVPHSPPYILPRHSSKAQ
jgi:hypothetical protein